LVFWPALLFSRSKVSIFFFVLYIKIWCVRAEEEKNVPRKRSTHERKFTEKRAKGFTKVRQESSFVSKEKRSHLEKGDELVSSEKNKERISNQK